LELEIAQITIKSRSPFWIVTCTILGILAPYSAFSHQAISGWVYPLDCCDDRDCRQLDEAEVTVRPDFYIWKGKHISFTSPKIRNSPDEYFHGCENAHWGDTSGNLEITCFFVPTSG
jgi:hypothetical protein